MTKAARSNMAGQKIHLKSQHPIFIVGCPRSGTTLLASRLNQHPLLSVTPETHFFETISNSFLIKTKYPLTKKGIYNLLSKTRMRDLGIEIDSFMQSFSQTTQSYINIFDLSMELYRKRANKKYWCEKSPQHLKHLKQIFHYYPRAKVICILRDGRDVALSLSKAPWRERNLCTSSLEWNEYIDFYFNAKSMFPKENFYDLTFENLAHNSERTLKSVCDFLAVEYEFDMISSPIGRPNLVPSWEINWKGNVMKPIDKNMAGKWRKQATFFQKNIMNSIMGINLRKLQYSDVQLNLNKCDKIAIEILIVIAKIFKPLLEFIGKYSRFRQRKYHLF